MIAKMSENGSNEILVTDLPDEILKKIMLYLSFDEIAQKRIVCKKFDAVSKGILNLKSKWLSSYIGKYMADVKSALPRRDSAKIAHPLYGHFRVLNTLNIYFCSLVKKYCDYIEKDVCCFIAGKVIDEAIRILKFIKNANKFASHKITDEFCDIANMAEEHFKEVVEPSLKIVLENTDAQNLKDQLKNGLLKIQNYNNILKSNLTLPAASNSVKKNEPSKTFRKFHYRTRRNKIAVLRVRGQIVNIKSRLLKQTQSLNKLKNHLESRLECIEQKLNCLREDVKKTDPLEFCKRIFSRIKLIWKSKSAKIVNTENKASEVSIELQFSNLERKMDHLSTLLHVIVFVLLTMVIMYCF